MNFCKKLLKMVDNKVNFDWENLAIKGGLEGQLKEELRRLKENLINRVIESGESPFSQNSSQLSNEFINSVKPQLDEMFLDFSFLTKDEKVSKRKQFFIELCYELDLIINRKACCSIEFEGYAIYSFFKALSSLLDEVEIKVYQDKLYILTMDPLRIVIFEVIIVNKTFKFYKEGMLGFNLNDLQKALKCKSSDESKINLIFGKDKLYISINSKKFHSHIERELNCINFHESGKLDIDELHIIKYPCCFKLSKDKLEYLLDNFGLYSEIIKIRCYKDKVSFIELGESGNNEISWNSNSIPNFFFNPHLSKEEENKSELNSLKYYEGIYSLDFFNMTYKMANLLDKSELITLSMKEKHPLKSEMIFPKLGDALIKLYISPRG